MDPILKLYRLGELVRQAENLLIPPVTHADLDEARRIHAEIEFRMANGIWTA